MKMLKPKLSVWIALAISGILFSAARPAQADLLWDWSYHCGVQVFTKCQGGSGQYTSTEVAEGPSGNQYYVVTSITGTVEGNTITSLLPVDSFLYNNDNKISANAEEYTGQPYLHYNSHAITGIAFLTNGDPATAANADLLFTNFIDDEEGYFTQFSLGQNKPGLPDVAFSAKLVGEIGPTGEPSPIPEPNSLILLGSGLAGILGVARRKMKRA